MSFSKAKIQRFNDITDCTPSPAKYNVLTQEKIKLGIISKPGTSIRKISPNNSEIGSVHSTPCFQTPTVPVKTKKILGLKFKSAKSEAKLSESEELRNKIVECENKDQYIKDLTEQIEELKENQNKIEKETERLQKEKEDNEKTIVLLQGKNAQDNIERVKQYTDLLSKIRKMGEDFQRIKQTCEQLKNENVVDLSKFLHYINIFQELYNNSVKTVREEFEEKLIKIQRQHLDDLETLTCQHVREKEELEKQIKDFDAKIQLLEENLKDANVLNELQIQERMKEIETDWNRKLEEKEKEAEAILKECQAISEYSIIQSEIEKNQIKNQLEETEKSYKELEEKFQQREETVDSLKTEKHAYELSITTFRDTIEVLKKRLLDSDQDVVQLKEELEKNEEKILEYERKCMELSNQLQEAQNQNEELEMQCESTSKLMQNNVKIIEKELLTKVEKLREELIQLQKDKELLNTVLAEHHEQQVLINEARLLITRSSVMIEDWENKQVEFEAEINLYKKQLKEEAEEAAEIRKKYIEKSGKYDELAQQFEQILQELDIAKGRIQELENLVGPYQEQIEACQYELKLVNEEKSTLANEAKELESMYAEIFGHHNLNQKIKHLNNLAMKKSELFEKNLDLESKNSKLNKLVEKLRKEIDDMKKGKKIKIGEDKENIASPKSLKGIQSPGPLKDKN